MQDSFNKKESRHVPIIVRIMTFFKLKISCYEGMFYCNLEMIMI
jgi:hypothetical protein